jgi:hypothetical protein
MPGGMLGEVRVGFPLAQCEVRKSGALGRGALDGQMPVLLESVDVGEDRLDR